MAGAPAFVALAANCLLLFLDAKGAPLLVSLGAALLAAMFIVLAGSLDGIPPGGAAVFLLVVLFTFAGAVTLISRVHRADLEPFHLSSTGTVLYERPWGRGRVILVDTPGGKYVGHLPPSSLFLEGDRVRVDGSAQPLEKAAKEGDFDEARFWKAKGAVGKIRRPDVQLIGESRAGILGLRRALRERILMNLPPLMRGHLLAALLGGRDPDLAERHSAWGTSHLLAVSGLHTGMVVLVIFLLIPAGPFRIPAASLVMWLYVLCAGASASALRAALMIQAGFIGKWLGRPSSTLNAVSVAGLFLLFWRPWFFWDLGWRLSMTAALILSCLFSGGGRGGRIAAPVLLWLATAGMVTGVFGSVPVAGMIINFLAVPVFTVLLPLSFFLAVPSLAGIPGGWILAEAGEGLYYAWGKFADLAASLLSWEAPYSDLLSFSGVALTAYLVLAGLGFRRLHAALFAIPIALFLALL
ncbi:MAG TPA: ComEC/Rec2 family competence protein [Synergistales bacterium]|nr:ComEC/Rec2 family competence protein [Synergistales bacterium]HRS48213.1 ComEC/Rec2 family competence protein [Thermovirgaceae bacterium]